MGQLGEDMYVHTTHVPTHIPNSQKPATHLEHILDGAPGAEVAVDAQAGPDVLELFFWYGMCVVCLLCVRVFAGGWVGSIDGPIKTGG